MRTILALVMSVSMLTGLGLAPAFAQEMMNVDPVTVSVDMDAYMEGDTIVVTGTVLQRHDGGLSVQIISPNGNLVSIGQPDVGLNNMFVYEFTTGDFMIEEGIYTINAVYTLDARTPMMGSTTFMYTPVHTPGIMVDGTDIEPEYRITSGMVSEMYTDPSANMLTIMLENTGDGSIVITLPSDLINSQTADGADDAFFVLVDNEEVDFEETASTDDSRTLMIQFMAGSERIDIIGTSVAVPEFGVVAVLILGAAIASVIVLSARSRLSLVPRL